MTEKLFYSNPMQRSFDAVVQACAPTAQGFAVRLDRTAFYPEGGGQPGDTGTLNGVPVYDTQENADNILHLTDAPLPVGVPVHGVLHWARRFRHMQCHTGEHILSGLAHTLYGCNNIGFHLGTDTVTVDFDVKLDAAQVAALEQQANEALWADVPTEISWPDACTRARLDYRCKKALTGDVRIVYAGGVDVCACCGLHVPRSGMVGLIKVTGHTVHRDGVRLTLRIGPDALSDYADKCTAVTAVSHTLSAKPHEIAQAVSRMDAALAAAKSAQIALYEKYFRTRIAALPAGQPVLFLFEDGLTPVETRQCAALLAAHAPLGAAFSQNVEGGFQYALCSASLDVRPYCKQLNARLNGRGGGKPAVAQGACQASRSDIEAFLSKLTTFMP